MDVGCFAQRSGPCRGGLDPIEMTFAPWQDFAVMSILPNNHEMMETLTEFEFEQTIHGDEPLFGDTDWIEERLSALRTTGALSQSGASRCGV